MKFFARCFRASGLVYFLLSTAAISVLSQTPNPKTSLSKPKPAASKTSSTAAKPKAAPAKPKPTPVKSATTAAKPKPAAKPVEKTEWEKAIAVTDAAERIAALRKFLKVFPESERKGEAHGLIVTAAAELGNASIAAGDLAAAAQHFKTAASDAPSPIPDQLFNDTLSKFGANLFFRGARTEAFEIVGIIEKKAATNAEQLLSIVNFYMSIENGAEARRLAEDAIKIAPTSAAYQTLGLANRIDFRLDESAAAYEKALEIEPDSLSARRGLAEMKRSSGKADDAVALYREILERDKENTPAITGLVLALFESGKTGEAEAELAKALEANEGNVILLAGAAYWYAANKNGDKAVSNALKAIAVDPRFIWSHIALARGYLNQNNPAAAEKTLIDARRYGNFPTLNYEIASTRMAAGYFREAAEELAKSFSMKDGMIRTNLGGRVARESKDFTELIGFERRASIFAPTAADSPESAAKLTALLELKQKLDASEPVSEEVSKTVDDFVRGDDRMKVHRQIFAANQLLEKKVALPKVLELTKAAMANVDAGLEMPNASIAVMAAELYQNRALAASRGEFLNVPEVPRQTLSAILRGEIEEIAGWALYQSDATDDAVIRLKRAVSVLPVDSAWWRSSTWRLGNALAKAGKETEALDQYIKSYKSGQPNAFSYSVIEDLYKRVNGTAEGLETRIGPKPALPGLTGTVAQKEVPSSPTPATPEPTAQTSPTELTKASESPSPSPLATDEEPKASATPKDISPMATPVTTPTPVEAPVVENSPSPELRASIPAAAPAAIATARSTPKRLPTPEVVPVATPTTTPTPESPLTPVVLPTATPADSPKLESSPTPEPSPTPEVVPSITPTASPTPESSPTPEVVPAVIPTDSPTPDKSPTPEAVPSVTPTATPTPESSPTPEVVPAVTPTESPTPDKSPTPEPVPSITPTAAQTPEIEKTAVPESTPSPNQSPRAEPDATKSASDKTKEVIDEKTGSKPVKELFPPVVISIPQPGTASIAKSSQAAPSPSPSVSPTPEIPDESGKVQQDPSPGEIKKIESRPSDVAVADGRPRVVVTGLGAETIKPCTLTVSEETITLQSGGGDLAVIVGRSDDEELADLKAVSTSPENVIVRREPIANVKARALFVLRAAGKTGIYQVTFELPCGKKEIVVRVR